MILKPMLVAPGEAGMPLGAFLALRLKISRKQAKRLLDDRLVLVNRRRIWMARHALQPRDQVEIPMASGPSSIRRLPIPILYRDGEYLVVNKPSGMTSNGPGSVEELLRTDLKLPALEAVHRLDRDTTGCLWFSLEPAARERATALFKDRRVIKTYHAIVAGRVTAHGLTLTTPLDDQPAVTRVQVLDSAPWASHVKILIETGRTHQIRKHMASVRHPVLGDRAYLTGEVPDARFREVPRQMLHASGLVFPHPKTGQPVRIKAPLPLDFKRVLNRLRLRV